MKHLIALVLLLVSSTSMAKPYCANYSGDNWGELGTNSLKSIMKREFNITVESIRFNLAKSKVFTTPSDKIILLKDVKITTTKGNKLIPDARSAFFFDREVLQGHIDHEKDLVVYLNHYVDKLYDAEGTLLEVKRNLCAPLIYTSFINEATGVSIRYDRSQAK